MSSNFRLLFAGAAAMAVLAFSAQADIISVDFQPNAPFSGRNSVNFTGVESQAATANSIFDNSNIWNYLGVAPAGSTTTNPAFSNLVDSTGATTNVGISFTGTISSANDTPIDNNGSNGLENDYFVTTGSNVVDYTISGLAANTQVAFYIYSPNFTHYDSADPNDQPNRGFQLTANGNIINVPSGFGTNNALAYVTTNASGDITGTWSTPNLNEGNWSGFQIGYPLPTSPTPEPVSGTFVLAGLLMAGVVVFKRKRIAA